MAEILCLPILPFSTPRFSRFSQRYLIWNDNNRWWRRRVSWKNGLKWFCLLCPESSIFYFWMLSLDHYSSARFPRMTIMLKIRSHSFSCEVGSFLYIFQQHLRTRLKLWATLVFLGAKGTSIIDWLGERLNFLSQFPTRRRGGYTSMLVSRLLFILGSSHLLNNVGVVVKLSLGTLSFCC